MRIFILLLFISQSIFAQDIDWTKMDQEMQYLRQNAFLDKEEMNSDIQNREDNKRDKKEEKNQKRSYTLRRKPKTNQNLDPNILPLEQQYFDKIRVKYSAPKRVNQQPKTKEKIERSIETPVIPNLDF